MFIVTFEEKHQLKGGTDRALWLERSRKFEDEDEDATKDFVERLYKEMIDLGTVRDVEVWSAEKVWTKIVVDFEE